jgi:hypothetical protein
MTLPTIFANLAGGNQPLALIDAMFDVYSRAVAIPCGATGTNAITLTPPGSNPVLSSYSNYNLFSFTPAFGSTGPVTIGQAGLALLPAYRADGLTQIGSGDLAVNHYYFAMYSSGLNAGGGGFYIWASQSGVSGGGGTSANLVSSVGGRVTLATGVPVMTSSFTGVNQHFWTPYNGRSVPLNVSGTMTMTDLGGELSQLTTDTTKSPAAVTAASVYYLFAWNDSGTFRVTRGPAWTNDTTPGAGNALTRLQGVLVNTNAITNGPGAQLGTLVGAVRSGGDSLLYWQYGTSANPPTQGALFTWNMFNRVDVEAFVQDTSAWTGPAVATWRSANNRAANAISFLQGLAEDGFSARYHQYGDFGNGVPNTNAAIGVGYDVTNALAAGCATGNTKAITSSGGCPPVTSQIGWGGDMTAHFFKAGDLGVHTINAIEIGNAGGAINFGGPIANTMGLFFKGRF